MTSGATSSVPITMVAGYLGSGKTTLINRLLRNTTRRLAVLVNDVGRLNIDAALIARHNGDTIELTNGCVCCGIDDGLAEAFLKLSELDATKGGRAVDGFDQVVIELSGVAEPARVRGWADTPGFALDAVVTVVDAERFAALDTDRWVADTVQRQVQAADLMVVTKLGSEPDDALTRRLAELAPEVPVLADRSIFDDNETATTEDLSVLEALDPNPASDTSQLPAEAAPPTTGRVPLQVRTSVVDQSFPNEAALVGFLEGLDVLRAKGIVSLGEEGRTVLVQMVGRRINVSATDLPETGLVTIELAN